MNCSVCKKDIKKNTGYVYKTVIYSKYDCLEIFPEDLSKDIEFEIKQLIEIIKKISKKKIEEDIVIYKKLNLCKICKLRIVNILKEHGLLK